MEGKNRISNQTAYYFYTVSENQIDHYTSKVFKVCVTTLETNECPFKLLLNFFLGKTELVKWVFYWSRLAEW